MTATERKKEIKNYMKQIKTDGGYLKERDSITGEERYFDKNGVYYNTALLMETLDKIEKRNERIEVMNATMAIAGQIVVTIAGYYLTIKCVQKILS